MPILPITLDVFGETFVKQCSMLANERYDTIEHGTRKGCHYYDTTASAWQAVSW